MQWKCFYFHNLRVSLFTMGSVVVVTVRCPVGSESKNAPHELTLLLVVILR